MQMLLMVMQKGQKHITINLLNPKTNPHVEESRVLAEKFKHV